MKLAHAQYFHDITHADVKVIVDEKRGYDTLDIQLIHEDGSKSDIAIFFAGKADIRGGQVVETATPQMP
ncbi:MAG TPA: hypothetical protein VGN93_07245 [Shinella sp.]|jgi:hypothetical protein|uniref:hypothetical protein n=1 Tax=Shinella sp. TaxID=1870904 RepID=UPI002E12AB35|nr:hypothetical protein [Shinella sp.]